MNSKFTDLILFLAEHTLQKSSSNYQYSDDYRTDCLALYRSTYTFSSTVCE